MGTRELVSRVLGRTTAAAMVGVALVLSSCGTAEPPAVVETADADVALVAPRQRGWSRVADSPLSGRTDAGAYWTGKEVVVVGGTQDPPCPPEALCTLIDQRSDGASYDPANDTWRPIAESPVPLAFPEGVVADGDLYFMGLDGYEGVDDHGYFLRYEPAANKWTELDAPTRAGARQLIVTGDGIVAYLGEHGRPVDGPEYSIPGGPYDIADSMWDPATETWSDLPRDPIAPSGYRFPFTVGGELYLHAANLVPYDTPRVERLTVFREGAWTELPVAGDEFRCDDIPTDPPPPVTGDNALTHTEGSMACVFDVTSGLWGLPPVPPEDGSDRDPFWDFGGWVGDTYLSGDRFYDTSNEQWLPLEPPATLRRQGAAMATLGDEFFTFGGTAVLDDGPTSDADYDDAVLHHDAWIWTPPA